MWTSTAVKKSLELLLIAHGVTADDAAVTADVLVEGTLRGYFNHGVERIFSILEALSAGSLNPTPNRQLLKSTTSCSVLDGDFGLGHPAAVQAMHLTMKLASKHGVAAVGVINAGHIGVLSYYSELASSQYFFAIVMSTSSPAAVLPGGNKPVLGTNPIAYSFPTSDGPVTADFSTTAVSRGTLMQYAEENNPIPSGWAVDGSGSPTLDPHAGLEGGILPIGGSVKGTLLNLLVGLLAGPLIGGRANHQVRGTRDLSERPTKGDLFLCFDIDRIAGCAKFDEEVADMISAIRLSGSSIRTPGEESQRRRRENLAKPMRLSPELQRLLIYHGVSH